MKHQRISNQSKVLAYNFCHSIWRLCFQWCEKNKSSKVILHCQQPVVNCSIISKAWIGRHVLEICKESISELTACYRLRSSLRLSFFNGLCNTVRAGVNKSLYISEYNGENVLLLQQIPGGASCEMSSI